MSRALEILKYVHERGTVAVVDSSSQLLEKCGYIQKIPDPSGPIYGYMLTSDGVAFMHHLEQSHGRN